MTNNNADKLFMSALSNFSNKNLENASQIIDKIIAIDPKHVNAWILKADIFRVTNNINKAIEIYEKYYNESKGNPNYHYSLASSYAGINKFEEAINELNVYLEIKPGDISAINNKSFFHHQIGNYKKAEQGFREIIKVNKSYLLSYVNLGKLLFDLKDYNEAIKVYKSGLAVKKDIRILTNLGSALFKIKNYKDSEKYLLDALDINPNYDLALINLASVYLDIYNIDKAIQLLTQAIKQGCSVPQVFNNLGVAYLQLHLIDKAIDSFTKAIKSNPKYAPAYANISTAYQGSPQHTDKVLNYASKAIEIDNNNSIAHNNLGLHYRGIGDYKKAKNYIKNAIKIDPDFYEAIYSLASIDLKEIDTKEENIIKNKFENSQISDQRLAPLGFTLFKIEEKKENYPKAFSYLKKANDMIDYNLNKQNKKQQEENVMVMKEIFDDEVLSEYKNIKRANNKLMPIFILGMPRSGSTLVEQIISSHSEVTACGELSLIQENFQNNIMNHIDNDNLAESIKSSMLSKSNINFQKFSEEYLANVQNNFNISTSYFTDKLPGNFYYLGYLKFLFPYSKIIHTTRNANDTIFSMYSLKFAGNHPYAYNITKLRRYYTNYEKLMNYWKSFFGKDIYDLNYEALVGDIELETKKVLEFIDLEYQEDCINFHKNKRIVRTASTEQVRKKLYSDSINKWKKYEKFMPEIKLTNN